MAVGIMTHLTMTLTDTTRNTVHDTTRHQGVLGTVHAWLPLRTRPCSQSLRSQVGFSRFARLSGRFAPLHCTRGTSARTAGLTFGCPLGASTQCAHASLRLPTCPTLPRCPRLSLVPRFAPLLWRCRAHPLRCTRPRDVRPIARAGLSSPLLSPLRSCYCLGPSVGVVLLWCCLGRCLLLVFMTVNTVHV